MALLFLAWEGVEQAFVRDDVTAHRVHHSRGISTSLLTAAAVGLAGRRQHRRREESLAREAARRTREACEARQLLELVVDATPASLVVLDQDLRVVQANRMAERVHGGSIVGAACHAALAGRQQRCDACPALDTFATRAARAGEATHLDPRTGEVLAVETHPLHLADGLEYVLLVERVVTEQKRLQARLFHQEKMAAFGLLAASVAHEMGNTVSAIETQLQLLDEERLAPEDGAVVATVRQEAAHLRRILRELVDFARRRRDDATLVSVQAVVSDTLRLMSHDARMRHVRTTCDFDREAPPVFMVEDHLMQVTLDLLLNAVDAMPSGGTLRLEIRPVNRNVVLRIHDTGTGMDRMTAGRCFEPLFTTKAPGKGTGLGLSISRDILRSVGGDIELHSAPERGTIAVVTIPAAPNAAGAAPGALEPRHTPAPAQPILIVEDEGAQRHALASQDDA